MTVAKRAANNLLSLIATARPTISHAETIA